MKSELDLVKVQLHPTESYVSIGIRRRDEGGGGPLIRVNIPLHGIKFDPPTFDASVFVDSGGWGSAPKECLLILALAALSPYLHHPADQLDRLFNALHCRCGCFKRMLEEGKGGHWKVVFPIHSWGEEEQRRALCTELAYSVARAMHMQYFGKEELTRAMFDELLVVEKP